ncbi:MAG TPA: type I phosphomannose isomerase catalytic subunit [Pirellula sp.]|nr:type I phosphomannose isomerase catalytic subunit [Pirellula sp.]
MFLPDQPIRFQPIFRSYIWGGDRLASQLGKKPPGSGIWAESWEIVDHREGESIVIDGAFAGWTLRQLIESFPNEVIGRDTPNERFPLLLKYLDCQRVLSVQVHPDDAYGAKMPQPDRGKTEAWYVIDAKPDAKLYAGLQAGVDRQSLLDAIEKGETVNCLHVLSPKPGDCVFIPAGTVHALGAGLLVAEIQQASDCTFRLFDWDRVDKDGQPRQLHIDQALDVIDFERGPIEFVPRPQMTAADSQTLVNCDKFTLKEFAYPGTYRLDSKQLAIVTVPKGNIVLRTSSNEFSLERGQTVLVPVACPLATFEVSEGTRVLVSTLPGAS